MEATGAAFGKSEVAPAREFQPSREHGGIKVQHVATLHFDSKHDTAQGERLFSQNPATGAANGAVQGIKLGARLSIGEALQVDGAQRKLSRNARFCELSSLIHKGDIGG